jgi:peptidoglycan/xylan/chitin deacetylase (PgdA/CDA1 family)
LYHATYHSVPGNIKKGLHNVSPREFERQIAWMQKKFRIVTVDEYFSESKSKGLACITFDDGYESIFAHALPILIKKNLPSTVFINGCTLEKKAFWRDKVRYLINNQLVEQFIDFLPQTNKDNWGFSPDNFYRQSKSPGINSKELDHFIDAFLLEIGSGEKPNSRIYCAHLKNQLIDHPLVSYGNHTYNHYVLASLSETEQKEEIVQNHQLLIKLKLRLSRVFSIPFGGLNDINSSTWKILESSSYSGVLFNRQRLNFTQHNRAHRSFSTAYRYMQPSTFESFQTNIFRMAYRDPLVRWLFKT